MSDFFQNETNEDVLQEENNVAADELSTVFSAPAEHKKKATGKKSKKKLLILLSGFLALAILIGGTFAVVKLIPPKDTSAASSDTAGSNYEEITLKELESGDLKSVTVTNTHGTFELYSEKDTSGAVSWGIKGYGKDYISVIGTEMKASSVAKITVLREITTKTIAECGLNKPIIVVDAVTEKDEKYTLKIGLDSPDNSGCYVMISDSDKIYLASSSIKEEFQFTALDLASTNNMSGFILTDDMKDYQDDNEALSSFDKITVSGVNFPEPVVIVPDSGLFTEYMPYRILSPTERIAENVDGVFGLFQSGLAPSGAYSFDVSAKSLAKFGLDKPDFIATMQIKSSTHTYKFKLQEDGNYAVVCDGSKLIQEVAASSVPFVEYKTKDFYSSWVCINGIDELSGFSIKTPEKTHTFGIKANEDENSEDNYIITYEGKEIDCQSFQDFYQKCISLSCSDYTVDKLTASPEYSIIFTFKEDVGGQNVIDFVKASETRYQYRDDGVDMGKISSSSLKKVLRELEKLVG